MAAESTQKKAVVFCTCSGACPGMAKIDFWTLAERVRLELGDQVEFIALHPRLCEEDGERLMGRVLDDTIQLVSAACPLKRQEKLLRDGFAKAGVPMDQRHWIPVNMSNEDTDTVFERIKAAIAQPATTTLGGE